MRWGAPCHRDCDTSCATARLRVLRPGTTLQPVTLPAPCTGRCLIPGGRAGLCHGLRELRQWNSGAWEGREELNGLALPAWGSSARAQRQSLRHAGSVWCECQCCRVGDTAAKR